MLHTVEFARRQLMHSDRIYTRLFLLTARRAFYATPPSPAVARQIKTTATLLAGMADYCAQRDIRLVVIAIPQQFAVLCTANGFEFPGVDPVAAEAGLAAVAREHGALWIDTLPALADDYRAHRVDLYYRVDGHLTARGNQVLGEFTAGALRRALGR
jgi:hypothetical protein